jgi:hypothetical protein
MPRLNAKQPWEIVAANQVKALGKNQCLQGLSVKNHQGKVRLRYRPPEEKEQGATLPFKWSEDAWGDAYTRIRNIVDLMAKGHGISAAADIAEGRSPRKKLSWKDAVLAYEQQKTLFDNAIKSVTWNSDYRPVLNELVDLMAGPEPPTNGNDLVEALVVRYEAGSRTRNIRTDAATSFLKFCVEREYFPGIWVPTKRRGHFVARKPAHAKSYKADPITDDQILEILAGIKDTERGTCWKNVIKLMAVYGLRGIAEVAELEVKYDNKEKEYVMWCNYQKRSGRGVTSPGRVEPFPPLEPDGYEVEWNLVDLMVTGKLKLPDLSNKWSFQTFMQRQKVWVNLKEELLKDNINLTGKSFRDSYSLRGHNLGVSAESVARSMRHSLKTHVEHYPLSDDAGTREQFKSRRRIRPANP